jgi:hypothetical protein
LGVGRSLPLPLAEIHLSEGAAIIGVIGALGAMLALHFKARSYIREVAGVKESGTMSITGQPIMVAQAKEWATTAELESFVIKTDKRLEHVERHIIPREELLARFASLEAAGASRLSEITQRLDRIAGIEGKTAAAFEQFQRDLPNLIRHAK